MLKFVCRFDGRTEMYFVYVLKSSNYNTKYVGSTNNIDKRLKEHNKGKVRYTKGRKPWKLIYSEKYETRSEAVKREQFLKSGRGRKLLDQILDKDKQNLAYR